MMWFTRLVWIAISTLYRGRVAAGAAYDGQRRNSRLYRRKREQVKLFWIAAGVLVLFEPVLYFVFSVSLFTTFLSFMYLDESEASANRKR